MTEEKTWKPGQCPECSKEGKLLTKFGMSMTCITCIIEDCIADKSSIPDGLEAAAAHFLTVAYRGEFKTPEAIATQAVYASVHAALRDSAEALRAELATIGGQVSLMSDVFSACALWLVENQGKLKGAGFKDAPSWYTSMVLVAPRIGTTLTMCGVQPDPQAEDTGGE